LKNLQITKIADGLNTKHKTQKQKTKISCIRLWLLLCMMQIWDFDLKDLPSRWQL
jgi:hypothetical protein